MSLHDRCAGLTLALMLLLPVVGLGNTSESDDWAEDSEAMRALASTAHKPWEDYDKFLQSRQALSSHGPELSATA